jgi:hypothetical protein
MARDDVARDDRPGDDTAGDTAGDDTTRNTVGNTVGDTTGGTVGSTAGNTVTLRQWVLEEFPGHDVVVASDPEPTLTDYNLICITEDPDVARAILVDWERVVDADGALGYVALGTTTNDPSANAAVDRRIGRRTLVDAAVGALPGAIAFGLVIAVVVALVSGWSGVVIGAFFGGVAFGLVPGALVTYVRGTGWGSAYEDSFTPADTTSVAVASIHVDQPELIPEARQSADGHDGIRVATLDRAGRVVR